MLSFAGFKETWRHPNQIRFLIGWCVYLCMIILTVVNKTCTQDFKYNETVYPTQDEEETSTVIVCKCTNLTFVINVPQSAVNVTCTFNIIWPVCVLYIDFYHNHEKQLIIVHWQSSFMSVWKYFLNIHVPVFNFCSLWLQLFLFVYCASVAEHQEPVTEYLQSRIDNFSVTENWAKLFHIAVV